MARPSAGTLPAPRTSRAVLATCAAALVASLAAPAAAAPSEDGSAWRSVALDPGLATVGDALQDVIVRSAEGVRAAAAAVTSVGGLVESDLPLVDGVEARVPASSLVQLSGQPGVVSVTKDRRAEFVEYSYDAESVASGFVRSTQANAAWAGGNQGQGVGVAVLDTGVSEMNDFAGRIVHGPDLSGEGTVVDTYGHGTVMAGAIAGSGADSAEADRGAFTGVAPKAHLVSVKVAGRNGAVDVSTILQGMHFVSAYKDQLGIRVMNLSWGVPSTQDPAVDPLNYAVQRLWQQGIVVVVAAGNSGPTAGTITKPADDPLVLTVGAYNDKGTGKLEDDSHVDWTSAGPTAQGLVKPDVVAPGRSLTLARSYGSKVEVDNPKALVSPSYIRGSGTSQAAAVVSGVAALLIGARPHLTPDQVKHLLRTTAVPLSGEPATEQGAGRVRLAAALTADPGPAYTQTPTATGMGSIEQARGGYNVVAECGGVDTDIVGEIDVRCEPWDPATWTGSVWKDDAWTGSVWKGSVWTGSVWKGADWSSSAWDGSVWKGGTWVGTSSWSGETAWTGSVWKGSVWKGSVWKGSVWKGSVWKGSVWKDSDFTSGTYDDELSTFTSGTYDEETFLNAWWGERPPWTEHFPGETSEPAPTWVTGACDALGQKASTTAQSRVCS
jgi:serine protease AprX